MIRFAILAALGFPVLLFAGSQPAPLSSFDPQVS